LAIQILGLRPNPRDPDRKTERFFEKGWRAPSVQALLADPDKYIEQIPEAERYNMYFTVADCAEERLPGEKGRRLVSQDIIPFDVDDVDVTVLEETAKVAVKAAGLIWEQTATLFSGNGIQFFVGLKAPIVSESYFDEQRHHYRAIVDKINKDLYNAGLRGHADPSVFSAARLMRLPNTWNKKPNKPERKALVMQPVIVPIDYRIEIISGIPVVSKDEQIAPQILKKYPRPDTEAVLDECKFLKWAGQNQQDVKEPEWFAMLSVTARLDDGRNLSHKMSQDFKGYSRVETDNKIDQSIDNSGPRTCKNIQSVWGKCAGCKHFGTELVSPIMIRGPTYIRTQDTGFHTMGFDKSGNPKPGKPCYDDLRKFYEKTSKYITMMDSKIVYTWEKTHWVEMHQSQLENFAEENFKPKVESRGRSEFTSLLKCTNLRTLKWFSETTEKKINFQNGVLDMDAKELLPHSHEYGFRNVLPFDYDPEATAPRFEKFLEEITQGRQDLADILMEYAGYALSNDRYWEHKALTCVGEGRNGKSTFSGILEALAGEDNCTGINLGDLYKPENRYQLVGKLFNVSEETKFNALVDSSLFKSLSSGVSINVKKLYAQPYTVKNNCKMIVLCNELPSSRDVTHGLLSKFLIVPFDAQFDGATNDKFVLEKLLKELPGIFNLALVGYKRLHAQNGFTSSVHSTKARDDFQLENDPVTAWKFEVDFKVTDQDDSFSIMSEMYSSYSDLCIKSGHKPITNNAFFRRLKQSIPRYDERQVRKVIKPGEPQKRILLGVTFDSTLGF
jgi:putative DNA primase/helicase